MKLRVFLLGTLLCAVKNQTTAEGFYNIGRMIQALIAKKIEIKCCGTCLDARGLDESLLIEGIIRGKMNDLADWVSTSAKVLVF